MQGGSLGAECLPVGEYLVNGALRLGRVGPVDLSQRRLEGRVQGVAAGLQGVVLIRVRVGGGVLPVAVDDGEFLLEGGLELLRLLVRASLRRITNSPLLLQSLPVAHDAFVP